MKKYVLLVLLLSGVSFQSFAQESAEIPAVSDVPTDTSNSSVQEDSPPLSELETELETSDVKPLGRQNSLGDLVYIQPENMWVIGYGYSVSSNFTRDDYSGLNLAKSNSDSSASDLSVSYAILHHLALSISQSYVHKKHIVTSAGPASTEFGATFEGDVKGFGDPVIQLRCRILDRDEDAGFNLDATLLYSPKSGTSTAPDAGTQTAANALRGGDLKGVSIEVARKMWMDLELAFNFSFLDFSSMVSENASTRAKSEQDGFQIGSLAIGARAPLVSGFYAQGAATLSRYGALSGTSSTGKISHYDTLTYFSYSLGLDYEIKKDTALVALTMKNTPEKNSYYTSSGVKIDELASSLGYGINLVFQF